MERRVLIAVLLSFLVLYGYSGHVPAASRTEAGADHHEQGGDGAEGLRPHRSPTRRRRSRRSAAATAEAVELTPSAPAREIEIDNADVHAVFSDARRGAEKLEAEEVSRRPATSRSR